MGRYYQHKGYKLDFDLYKFIFYIVKRYRKLNDSEERYRIAVSEIIALYSEEYSLPENIIYDIFISYEKYSLYRSNPNKDMSPVRETWSRYRSMFVYKVAQKLGYI